MLYDIINRSIFSIQLLHVRTKEPFALLLLPVSSYIRMLSPC